jgi:hypothetical protein
LKQISYVKIETEEKPARAKTAAKRVRQPALTVAEKKKNTEQLLEDLRDSFNEIELIEAGKKKFRSADEFLASL